MNVTNSFTVHRWFPNRAFSNYKLGLYLTSLISCFAEVLSNTRSHHAGHLVFMYDRPL